MKLLNIISIAIIFVMGCLATILLSQLPVLSAETPQGFALFSEKSVEKASPYNWITPDQIKVSKEGINIDVEGAILVGFADTNSMDPLLDENSNGIEIIPDSIADIHIGDIVSYKSGDDSIIHRVVFIGADEKGWYCLMKGDNNSSQDPKKIRFDQIQRVLVGIIY